MNDRRLEREQRDRDERLAQLNREIDDAGGIEAWFDSLPVWKGLESPVTKDSHNTNSGVRKPEPVKRDEGRRLQLGS